MSKYKDSINETISKIDSIKKIAGDPTGLVDRLHDKILSDNSKNKIAENITELKNKIKANTKKKDTNDNIFSNMLKVANSFLDDPKLGGVKKEEKILNYLKDSASITIKKSKEIVKQELKTLLTGNISEICSGNSVIYSGKTYNISPKEIDIMNVLKISPESLSGKIMYEKTGETGKIKMNKELFNRFESPSPYTFTSIDNTQLIEINWDTNGQYYTVKPKQNSLEMRSFFDKYYETIEEPDIDHIIKTTMLLTIQGDGTEDKDFTLGLNNIERLIKKVLCFCNLLNTGQKPLKNNPTDLVTEFDDDISKFFDFNDTEGIDIDDEDSRYRRVLKFTDCNIFEIPVNNNHIEDFVYLDDLDVINTLKKTALDVNDNPDSYYNFLLNMFFLKIPITLLSSILTPKLVFPITFAYKVIKNITLADVKTEIKVLMGKLKKIFMNIISKLFKIFIMEFWKFIKKDLLKFITKVGIKILTNKLKRYKSIVLSLISLLTKLLSFKVNNCVDLFKLINGTIDAALNLPSKIPLPGLLLSFSDNLPGFSTDRAYMNIVELMNNSGVETGQLYGESNDLLLVVKSNIDGLFKEMDSNSFIKTSNKEINLTKFGVPVIIPPGMLDSAGKIF